VGDPIVSFGKDVQRLALLRKRAGLELPSEWLLPIDAEAQMARPAWGGVPGHPVAQRNVYESWLDRFGGAAASDLSDAEIKGKARAYALEARSMDIGELVHGGAWREYGRLVDFCRTREVEPPPVRLLLSGMGARVRCEYWWRRALRKLVARKCERGAMALGLVSKPAGQPYASNKAVLRRIDQNRRNAKSAEQTYFENDLGVVMTLAELTAKSVSNKAIRRGELMTRMKGCEAIAVECGHPGLFLTLTCPSRFHSTLRDGKRNPKHDGSDPTQAQAWLRKMWARTRAKLARLGIGMYGFRIAEPHHDGCPHWHALLWFSTNAHMHQAQQVLTAHWLADDGSEPGAVKHRVTSKEMISGSATGYVAKYVAKNIDDEGVGFHLDDYADGEIGSFVLAGGDVTPAMRVEAWASHWGIRQFQAIGQPPVTVWRELRRVREEEARSAGVNGVVHQAWTAAQRVGDVHASWAGYVKAQGGVMQGHKCRVAMRHEARDCEGLYGRAVRQLPVGVALNVKCSSTVWSDRRLWRRVERRELTEPVLVAQSAAPWTCVNNCTSLPRASDAQLTSGTSVELCALREFTVLRNKVFDADYRISDITCTRQVDTVASGGDFTQP
jgi:hypothetical protein